MVFHSAEVKLVNDGPIVKGQTASKPATNLSKQPLENKVEGNTQQKGWQKSGEKYIVCTSYRTRSDFRGEC